MRIFYLFILFSTFSWLSYAQTPAVTTNKTSTSETAAFTTQEINITVPGEFSSSDLPAVVIDTYGSDIADDPKIKAGLKIYNKGAGQRNSLTDIPEFDGYIGIEIRGSSSQLFPKKSYGFESRDALGKSMDTSFLRMPAENDWILNANYTDKTLMRNAMAYQVWQNMGHYATRYHFVELILNGQYLGIYIFSEKIKRDKNRLDIAKLDPDENSGDNLTGGYIIKIDKKTGSGGEGWTSSYFPIEHNSGQTIYFQYEYPKKKDITSQQITYIKNYVYEFETVLKSVNFSDVNIGFRKYANEKTFIDYFLVNEVSKNVDGYRLSTFLNKDLDSRGGKICMGPVWDYDIAWHNADYCEGDIFTGWAYQFPCADDFWQIPFWWSRLLEDPQYVNNLACRWQNLRLNILSNAWFDNYIDSISGQLMEAQQRNFIKWPILGIYVWPNPKPYPATYTEEVNALKIWMHSRLDWLDSNMPGNCNELSSLADNAVENTITIYPNPVVDNINIEFRSSAKSTIGISIINQQGLLLENVKPVFRSSGEWFKTLNISTYTPGVYLLRITIDGKSFTRRFIKI